MSIKHQFKPETRRRVFVLIYVISLFLCNSYVFAGEQNSRANINGVPIRYKFFTLKHITADNAIQYFEQLGIGTISKHPKPKTILVTARPDELLKAGAILKLVDANEPFAIKVISPASGQMPDNDAISAQIGPEIGGIISTFVGSLKSQDTVKAIVDVHNDSIILIAPVKEIEKIVAAIEQPQQAKTLKPSDAALKDPTSEESRIANAKKLLSNLSSETTEQLQNAIKEQVDSNDGESDVLFEELLSSLASAKEMAKSQAQELSQSTETETAVTVTPIKAPDEIATVPQRSTDSVDELAELLAGLDKETIAEILATAKAGSQPIPQPKEAAPKIEKPAEAVEPSPKIRTYEALVATDAEGELDLDLPDKLPIADLLRLAGEYLKLNYLYEPAEVTGEVTLNLRGPIKIKELYPLLEQVLQFKGLVMTRKGNLVIIVPRARAYDIDPDLYRATDRADIGDVIITRIFELEHIDTAIAQNFLTSMKLGVNISAIQEAGTLIVTGYAYRMARMEELLEMIDKPGEAKKFRFRQLEYTIAETLAPKVQTLAEQLGTISITISTSKTPAAAKAATPARARTAADRARQARDAKAKAAAAAARQTTTATPLEKKTVYLDFDERTNRILMIGLDEQLDEVEKLIDTLDIEQQDLRTLRLYEIQYVGAEEVRDKLLELEIISDTGAARRTGTSRIGRTTAAGRTAAGAKAPARPTTAAAARKASKDEPQVVIIESTNSLLARATAGQHEQIAVIIGYVDSELQETALNYKVYPLENKEPGELADVLNQLILETTSKQDKDAKITTTTTTKKIEDDIFIIPDEKTYSLIVYASKKNHQWISSLIKQLDEYRAMVLLDVTLVQITKDDAFNFDLDLLTSIPDLEFTSGQIPGVDSTVFDTLLAANDRNEFIEMKSSGGTFTGFYGDSKINALLTAVQTKKYGRVMARPKLLVLDNEEGTIQTTDTTYVTKIEQNVFPGDPPVTTETISYPDYSTGITLTIKPHISTGDMLRLEITLNRSGFTSELTGERPPDQADADVSTVVTIPNNSTIILGGMEKSQHNKGGDKIPILGDLPIIGGMFRSVAKSGAQDKLYIFVKAHILRPGGDLALADLKEVSQKNRGTFERLEEEMQNYEAWPGIEDDPMDPLKVLEQD